MSDAEKIEKIREYFQNQASEIITTIDKNQGYTECEKKQLTVCSDILNILKGE